MKLIVSLIFLALLLINFLGTTNIKLAKRAVNSSILIMFLLSVFKDGAQIPDHHVYETAYNLSTKGEYLSSIEISYYLISRLLGTFGYAGFNLLLGFYSTIFLLGFRRIILQSLENGPSSILLFYSNAFLVFGLIQIRAGAAIALVYLIILSGKGKLKSLFMWTSAIFLHVSSMIFIPLSFLRHRLFQKKTILIFLLCSIIIQPLVLPLVKSIIELIPISYVQQKILTYLLEERTQELSLNFIGPNFILRTILFLSFLRFYSVFKTSKDRLLLQLYIFGYYSYIALSSIPEIAFRIANSLFIAEIFLIPLLFSAIKQRRAKFAAIVVYSSLQLTVNIFFTSYFNYTQG